MRTKMQKILNLTQHPATAEQAAVGVTDLSGEELENLKEFLTFEELPNADDVESSALAIATLAACNDADAAMIGGAPFLMAPLEAALRKEGIQVLYAFSRRESVEQTMPDGSVRKVAVFRHTGFVQV